MERNYGAISRPKSLTLNLAIDLKNYFLSSENEVCGMVFIQNIDPIFWSEIEIGESYFLHKLAVLPRFGG